LAELIPNSPAANACNAVARKNRRSVVEDQPIPQREGPPFAVVFDGMAGDHLRL
jgi:hypothetical protein